MTKIRFTILGNQESPTGNPIPYFRTTQNSKWNAGARRYSNWKSHVIIAIMTENSSLDIKKITIAKSVRVDMVVQWKNKAHGDLDNIIKGILDAVFKNDKCVDEIHALSFVDSDKKPRGRVEVILTFKE